MKEFLSKLPKTTIATIAGAVLIYLQGRGYIGNDTATLISSILVACGFSVNFMSGKFSK